MNITVSFTAGTGTASRTLPAYDGACVVALSGLTLEGSNYLYLTTREGAMALATRALVSANAATLNLNNTTIQSFIPATARQNYQARLTIRNISTGTVIGTALVEIEPTANPNADVTRVGVDYATALDIADLQSQIDTIDGGSLSDATPAALGTAAPGTGEEASRGDHIHPMPTAANVGADPAGAAASLLAAQNDVTQEPTGFEYPDEVIVTGNGAGRTVTITGTTTAYCRGVEIDELVSGWVSPAHGADTATAYFLYFDGTEFVWVDLATLVADFFVNTLVAVAFHTGDEWIYTRECHGLLQHQAHQHLHRNIGTYLLSGGTLDDFTLASTTAADRRPSVAATVIVDEDLPTTLAALPEGTYTRFHLTGSGTPVFTPASDDIVSLVGDRPNWNEFAGGAWTETEIDTGDFMNVWVMGVPVAADSPSQAYRFLWIQGQAQHDKLAQALAETTADVNLGSLTVFAAEFLFLSRVTLRFTGGNWQFAAVTAIRGTRVSQTSSPQGSFLSSVSTDATISGTGVPADPLGTTPELIGAEPTQTAATDGEITAGTETEIRKITPAQLRLAAETFGGGGGGTPETTIVEVATATLQPGAHQQYIASNDLELLAPLTPVGSTLWETRIFMREGATLSYPTGWSVSGGPGQWANLATLSYLDGQWRLTWTAAFEYYAGARIFVKTTGSDANDGLNWASAKKTIPAAIAIAQLGGAVDVWIAAGSYNAGNFDGFTIPAGITLYGGFLGTEATLAERPHTAPTGAGANVYEHETVLSNRLDLFATAQQAVRGIPEFGKTIPQIYGCTIGPSHRGVVGTSPAGISVVDCAIAGNLFTGGNGGGAFQALLSACTLSGNSSTNGGGANTCTLTACTLSGNTATNGGGANTCTLTACMLSGNTATANGGGAASCTLTACTLSGNSATSQGGGAWSCPTAASFFFGNSATNGGGVHNNYNQTVRDCIIANNSAATTNVSGVYSGTAINCHILHNASSTTGAPSNATARNCVFWRNKNAPTGTITNAKYDADLTLADFAAAVDIAVGAPTGADIAALLAAIEAHGYAPAPGSALIDAGDSSFVTTSTDYRGLPRIVGAAVDVGAYEYQG